MAITGSFVDQTPAVKPPKVLGQTPAVQQPQTGGFNIQGAPQTQTFGAGNNLIGTQVNPTASQRGQTAAGMTDSAAQGVSNYQFQPFQGVTANTSQSQGIYDQLLKSAQSGGSSGYSFGGGGAQLNAQLQPMLDKVLNAPDRGQIANDLYGVLEERARPGFEQRLRSVGQKAAALGRVGAGLTTSELGDVETLHNRDLDLSRRQLASEGAANTLSDRLQQLGAARDVYGSVAAANSGMANAAAQMDRDRFNNLLTLGRDLSDRESADYSRRLGERNAGLDYDQQQFGNQRNKLGDMSIYENDIYGRDRDSRNELRGERDYQYGLERDAKNDQYRDYGLQQDANDRNWQRAMEMAQFGYGTNPSGALNAAAQQQQQQAQFDPYGLFAQWAKKQQQMPGTSSARQYIKSSDDSGDGAAF